MFNAVKHKILYTPLDKEANCAKQLPSSYQELQKMLLVKDHQFIDEGRDVWDLIISTETCCIKTFLNFADAHQYKKPSL